MTENQKIINSSTNKVTEKQFYKIKSDRDTLSFILFGIITFGIYDIVVLTQISKDINRITANKENTSWLGKSWPYYLIFILDFITVGFASLIWFENLTAKIGIELKNRNLPFEFSTKTFWGWFFFGRLILIGPFVYFYKLINGLNTLVADYNNNEG